MNARIHLEKMSTRHGLSVSALGRVFFIGVFATVGTAAAQQRKTHDYPRYFKVYSRDGSESLTATCRPNGPSPLVTEISCDFTTVRFRPPLPEGHPDGPMAVMEALKAAGQKDGKEPKDVELQLASEFDSVCANFRQISGDQSDRAPWQLDLMRQVLSACDAKDPVMLFRRLADHQQRTCDIYVDRFVLEFSKVKAGQWLYQQERPGLLSKVLKTYELTGEGYAWALAETRVPTEGSDEKPSRTIWSSHYASEYELPCDFIAHKLVQAP